MKQLNSIVTGALVLGATLPGLVSAEDPMAVGITPEMDRVEVMHNGETITITRNQDEEAVINPAFAKTSRKCPPFCIQPVKLAPGVTTVGEAEIFRFMERELEDGTGMIVDARTPSWYQKGTIPGSVNIPFTGFVGEVD